MERLREVALASIGKGCAFAALGIFCMMLGLSFDPLLMVQTGGALTLGLAAVLLLKANLFGRGDYRRTEAWLLLSPQERPPREVAGRLVNGVLSEACLRFARLAATASVLLWSIAAVFVIVGV
jgi:hypothetical protein